MTSVVWDVAGTSMFEGWYLALDAATQNRIDDRVEMLEQLGPALGRPVVDHIKTSRHHSMKELRTGSVRILFIFDPASNAVLLLGGDKQNNWTGWYKTNVPLADNLYDTYLTETKGP